MVEDGTKKYIGWFADYDTSTEASADWEAVWHKGGSHKAKGYISYNAGYNNYISVNEFVCNKCGRNIIDMGKGATNTWTVLHCRHSIAQSLICTKNVNASKNSYNW